MVENIANKSIDELAADTIRLLAADGIQKANSGHPGLPMGMADCAHILWTKFMNFNPDDPKWISRDRFVLSAGHGSMLLYSLLHLNGFDLSMDDLKSFRQWDSKTPGHPEYGHLDGVDTTTGPLGQGFTNGVGMAIAAKMLAERFDKDVNKLFGSNYIYAIVSDGDLMEGISHEAASIAGHLGLDNLVYLYDDNSITIEGSTDLAFSENIETRFKAYNWHVLKIDGHNQQEIESAIEAGRNETERPTIIICKTNIGKGSPNKVNTAGVHGSPLGADELLLTKENLGFPADKEFYISDEVKSLYEENVKRNKSNYDEWMKKFEEWKSANPDLSDELDKMLNNYVPDNFEEELLSIIDDSSLATRALSGKIIQKIAELIPGFVGGSADLAPSNNTYLKEYASISKGNFGGKNFHFGIREHAMGAILNGLALYGGFKPFGGTFLVFSDYMRPAVRLAAIMNLPVTYVFTHDSIFVGEDGPTHQPVEHMAALRIIPNVKVIRPADGVEVAQAWSYAVRNENGPVALMLTRQKLPVLNRPDDFDIKDINKGAYIVSKESSGKPELVIVGTGSEVSVAVEAKEKLEDSANVRVVSMPSIELFNEQPDDYKESIVPNDCKVVVVEAGITSLWGDVFRQPLLKLGLDRYGASAPYQILAEKFGFTGESVAENIKSWLRS